MLIELAIASYKAALQVLTRQAFPQDWAQTQNNLAAAYWERIKGDKAENIELAIDSYKAALQVTTRKAFPQQWATTRYNLAIAYSDRIKGDIAGNIEKAIDSYNAALQVYTQQASSQIKQTNYLHFSCHGTFNLSSPQYSCLLLAGADKNDELDLSKCLTLGNLFERDFNLNQCRLVVLSACETGLIDFKNTSDEYIGLPSGFLYAGSSSVVSSLWTVDDLSTSFLTIKFIQNLKDIEDISVPVALNQAQTWLRDATKEDLQEWANNLPLDSTKKGKIRRQLRNTNVEKPFNSPFHWAAFTAVGK